MTNNSIRCPHCDEVFVVHKNQPDRNFREVLFHMYEKHVDLFWSSIKC